MEPYDIPWQATFMCRAAKDFLFVRGKYNMIDVIDARTLKYSQTLDTKGCGVFSSITDTTFNMAYLGCYEGHFFAVDLKKMCIVEEKYLKLRQGIYDMVILPDPQRTIMVCQHFGYIEFINPQEGCVMNGGV